MAVYITIDTASPFLMQMWQNKHVTPILTNLVVLLAIGVSPLFSSYLYLQQPSDNFTQPVGNITVLEQLGLQNAAPFEFTDAAAGFIKASCEPTCIGCCALADSTCL